MGVAFVKKGSKDHKLHSSYGSFKDFRIKIAYCINLPYESMEGVVTRHPKDEGYYRTGYLAWDKVKSPLVPFLHHSDCEGHWTPEECAQIYPVLLSIVEKWEDDAPMLGMEKQFGLSLCALMKECAEENKKLQLC